MSDNPIGAGNQQESLSPEWVVGFVDGEGCFFVGVNRQPTMKVGWQVLMPLAIANLIVTAILVLVFGGAK